jgi:trypsin
MDESYNLRRGLRNSDLSSTLPFPAEIRCRTTGSQEGFHADPQESKRGRLHPFTIYLSALSFIVILCGLLNWCKVGKGADRLLRERRNDTSLSPLARIVGGSTAETGKYPFMVGLYWGTMNGNKPVCGGTLITPNVVVTAAHCVYSVTKLDINRHNLLDDAGVKSYKIKWENKRIHPDYDSNTNNNDIALIQLPNRHMGAGTAKIYRSGVAPTTLTAIGWGLLTTGGVQPDELMEVDLKDQLESTCLDRYGDGFNPLTMLCASDTGKDTCQGDSGGPLLAKGTSMLVGITSWGHECASNMYPGVYTRVSTFDTWIDDTVCNDLSPEDCVNGQIATIFNEPPTASPTREPSSHPSAYPTYPISTHPTVTPTGGPTFSPSVHARLSLNPSSRPTPKPSSKPSRSGPTSSPTRGLFIWTASREVERLSRSCTDQGFFITVGGNVHDCNWVNQQRDIRCESYENFCPETCEKPECL